MYTYGVLENGKVVKTVEGVNLQDAFRKLHDLDLFAEVEIDKCYYDKEFKYAYFVKRINKEYGMGRIETWFTSYKLFS